MNFPGLVRALSLFLVLILGAFPGRTAGPAVETVPLRESPAIHLEEKSHQTLDALQIKDDASIVLTHCTDITISCCDLHSIELIECSSVTIRNCWIHDSARCGVQTYHCHDVVVEGCRLERVASGVYAMDSKDIQVAGNFERNVQGPFPRGQMTQFDNVTGGHCAVRGNYAINDVGQSTPEDVINMYQSRGDAGAPILIEDNYLVGDPTQGSAGKSKSGSGIMLGDCGGAHLLCRRNVVLAAGQVGICVAGGIFISVEDNLILGGRSDVSNNGLYAWNQSKAPSHHVTIARNRVSWIDHNGEETSWWNGGGIADQKLADNHFADESLAAAIPPPPSTAPFPPHPYVTTDSAGHSVIRLPWQP
ncbi:MAG: right-handed parallel beta-helix repeat-containing protein [Chthoniobacter sp.]|uniref:right-handed parallel beta-helix repeat-containing protein n=1 Tax=Chthoniobacter sp. TaxID=2510640 RepID=UPI0032ADD2AB